MIPNWDTLRGYSDEVKWNMDGHGSSPRQFIRNVFSFKTATWQVEIRGCSKRARGLRASGRWFPHKSSHGSFREMKHLKTGIKPVCKMQVSEDFPGAFEGISQYSASHCLFSSSFEDAYTDRVPLLVDWPTVLLPQLVCGNNGIPSIFSKAGMQIQIHVCCTLHIYNLYIYIL